MVKLSLSKTSLSYMTKLILIWFLKKMVVSYTGLMVFLVLREYLGLRSYYLLVRQVGLYCHGLLVVVLLLVASLQPQEVAVEG